MCILQQQFIWHCPHIFNLPAVSPLTTVTTSEITRGKATAPWRAEAGSFHSRPKGGHEAKPKHSSCFCYKTRARANVCHRVPKLTAWGAEWMTALASQQHCKTSHLTILTHRNTKSFGLEETLETIRFQPPCHRQICLSLSQVQNAI